MGIQKLFQIIQSKAPGAVREIPIEVYASKKIAYDASNVVLKRQYINFW